MELNRSWQTDSSSASQENPRMLWNPKIHYCVLKRPSHWIRSTLSIQRLENPF